MKALIADMHTHSIMSGHAFGTIRELAQAAAEKQLQLLGITEHAPGIPGACDPIYFLNFNDAPRFLSGVDVLYGCEVNILNGGVLSLSQKHLDYLDYASAGIHSLCYGDDGIVKNTDNMIKCMENPKIRFITHPDDARYPLDYPSIVQAAKAYHTALEVNNCSLRNPRLRPGGEENYRKMLPLCMEQGVPIIVSSDAHDPSAVGDFSFACALLEQLSFDEELILNNDIQKLKEFLL